MRHLEDFRVGDVFELGSATLTEAEIVDFARRYDPQPRHLRSPGLKPGDLIASGWQVAAILMRLYVEVVLCDTAVEVSPGVDDLRWLRPVRPGDVLRGRVAVRGTTPSLSRPDCGILAQRGELFDRADQLVMRATLYGLVRRRR